MFLAVIAGYVIAASLAFCGVANIVAYISEADRGSGYSVFLHGLAIEFWPLAAAVGILLLIEIASIAEKIHIYQKMFSSGSAADAPQAPVKPKRRPAREEEEEGGYFRTHASAAPAPARPATPRADTRVVSREPGEEAAAQPPAQAQAQAQKTPQPAPRADAPQEKGLSYFKLD